MSDRQPKTYTLKSIVGAILTGVGVIAAALTIGGFGWYLAVEYHHLKDQVTSVHTAAIAQELKLDGDRWREKTKALETEVAKLKESADKKWNDAAEVALRKMAKEMFPDDKEWEAMGLSLLTALAAMDQFDKTIEPGIVSLRDSSSELQEFDQFVRRTDVPRTTEELKEDTNRAKRLMENWGKGFMAFTQAEGAARMRFVSECENIKARLKGADLLEYRTSEDGKTSYIIINKYRETYGINQATGNLENFTPSSQPTQLQRNLDAKAKEVIMELQEEQEHE